MKITFKPYDKTCSLDEGKTLMQAAIDAGIDIDGNCSSAGICGKCKVQITEGNDFDFTSEEERLLSSSEKKQGFRLACKFVPSSDVVAVVTKAGSSVTRKSKLMHLPEHLPQDRAEMKKVIRLEDNSIHNQTSDFEKLKQAAETPALKAQPKVLSKMEQALRRGREVTVCTLGNQLLDVESGDTKDQCYGMAFDIGSTTVVGILWNLSERQQIGATARTNPQGLYGADVISRITFAAKGDENLNILHDRIIDCLNDMTKELCEEYGINKEQIYKSTVVGNTTMSHIFAGVQPEQLALAPYVPVFCSPVFQKAEELGLDIHPQGEVYLLSNIAGHVGSDITAGVLASNIMEEDSIQLLVDIGTNGEIVLAGRGKAFTCSTAAGPAFEGASISQGMRAAAGAIEGVKIKDGEVILEVIDDEKPVGICGSGIIEAAAELVSCGIVEKGGRLVKPEKLKEMGFPPSICSRVRKGESGWEFVLFFSEDGADVSLTQKDIREVQLAKAALYTGIKILMKHMGIQGEDIEVISIAGAFGSYIDIDSALKIGIFPDVERSRIKAIGNAAGVGASMILLSEKAREKAEEQATGITHIELAAADDFQEEYILATAF